MRGEYCPTIISSCADCGVGTITLGEWYMVKNEIWEQAWGGRRKSVHGRIPGQEILCIGCLEKRIGRTLMSCDFTDAPVNDLTSGYISDRLRDRLTTDHGTINGIDGLVGWAVEGMLQRLPEHERARARAAWREMAH